MVFAIIISLLVLWILSFNSGWMAGNIAQHVLLVAAVAMLAVQLVRGKKV